MASLLYCHYYRLLLLYHCCLVSFNTNNTYMYKLQLLLGEGSSAFLKGNFEPFLRYLAMGDTWRSATPSSCSPTPTLPTLPRAASAVLKPCLTGVCFFRISYLITGSPYVFFYSPVRDNYLFGCCCCCCYSLHCTPATRGVFHTAAVVTINLDC